MPAEEAHDYDVALVGGDAGGPGQAGVGTVHCATNARKPLALGVQPAGKERRPCRFAPLKDHAVVASRLGFTDAAVLRATPDFFVGIGGLRVPAGYEP